MRIFLSFFFLNPITSFRICFDFATFLQMKRNNTSLFLFEQKEISIEATNATFQDKKQLLF